MLGTPTKNRDRLLTSEVAQRFFAEVNERAIFSTLFCYDPQQ